MGEMLGLVQQYLARALPAEAPVPKQVRVRSLGIPMQRQSGPEVTLGEAMRYLAELPWVPQAMRANGELEWRAVDERHVEVATRVGDQRAAVRFEFDDSGDIIGSAARERPREVDGSHVQTAWGGTFSDYETLGGVRLPTRGEAYWDLPEGRFVYWRGRITGLKTVDDAFQA
jgi:hypothetical protein